MRASVFIYNRIFARCLFCIISNVIRKAFRKAFCRTFRKEPSVAMAPLLVKPLAALKRKRCERSCERAPKHGVWRCPTLRPA